MKRNLNIQDEVPYLITKRKGPYAVLLNANAKQWTGTLHEEVLRLVPSTDLFLTENFTQGKAAIDNILLSGYKYILTGGGDGSITYVINQVEKAIHEGKVAREDAPAIGVLKMGTGNALAHWVGARDILSDLKYWYEGKEICQYDVNMIVDSNGEIFPFAGFGWDAQVINEYNRLKNIVKNQLFQDLIAGQIGYAGAILSTIVERFLAKPGTIHVTALDEVIQIRPNGDEITRFQAGEEIFEGGAKVCGCGSIPYWGYGVRMFPYANKRDDMFQFRTFNGTIRQLFSSPLKLWKGELGKETHDYLCKKIRIDLIACMPYQVAGDLREEPRLTIDWEVYPHKVKLVVPHLPPGEEEEKSGLRERLVDRFLGL